jgi:hypothetical protein
MICIVFLIVHSRVANRKIDSLLSSNQHPASALARLLGHAARQDAWTAQLRALLPQELASECRIGNVRDHVLTVHINNAAWATRLRFLIPELLQNLSRLADFTTVTEVRLKVVPLVPAVLQPTHNSASVRPPDPVPLLELASRVDSDGLRSAILRLAAYAETRRPSQNDTSAPAAEPAAD